jgi:hypothetical protein
MGSPSNGALVQALGGVREDDVAQYLKEHIKEYLPPAGVQPEDLKLELVPSDVNINAAKDAHGYPTAAVSQSVCHEGSFLIGGYCGFNADEITKAATGNLQDVGLTNARTYYCQWHDVPETFHPYARAACLTIKRK